MSEGAAPAKRPRLLLLSMYPLDQGMSGPTVRIANLRDELARLVRLDVVAGYRPARRRALVRYALAGRLRGLDAIYVESSTFLPAEADILFLGLARTLRIPVLTYVRDAYQLFDEYYGADTVRRWLGKRAFLPAVRALRAVSSALAFPTAGLAEILEGDAEHAVILPPGSPAPVEAPRDADADQVLFVGAAPRPAQGSSLLVDAVGLARSRGALVKLTVVSEPGEEPPGPHPEWLHVRRARGSQIHALLPRVVATVIPRPRSAYNDVALPIKLMEYLSYGRPMVVTDCTAQARVVQDADCGVVVASTPEALAGGILEVMQASAEQIDRWSRNASSAATRESWQQRARDIVEFLVGTEDRSQPPSV